MKKIILAAALTLAVTPAWAQQAPSRSDIVTKALAAQRDEALAQYQLCQMDAGDLLKDADATQDELQDQVEDGAP